MKKNKRRYHRHLNQQQRKRQLRRRVILSAAALILCVTFIIFLRGKFSGVSEDVFQPIEYKDEWEGAPEIDVQLLTPNPISRPQTKLEKINGIVVHYTANPGTSAQNNRDYFENLKALTGPKVSSHFVIGLEGEIIQCIPSSEWAYASNERNSDTLSIECCHPDESGKFDAKTYESLVQLTSWLCKRFELTEQQVIRHHDVTGKLCPKYFVEHEEEWEQFRQDVKTGIQKLQVGK